jgi:hypothetical protein
MFVGHAEATRFVAYSLREAERRVKILGDVGPEVRHLGKMTRVIGLVYDASQQDLIVVGQVVPHLPAVTLDDLVVALRARLRYQAWPEVSIEKTAETATTGKQRIRYEGGIAQTAFGRDLLEADVLLKQLSLGFLPTDIWGVRSYWAMAVDRHTQNPGDQTTFETRFWFYPRQIDVARREGILIIKDLQVGIRAEVLGALVKGQAISDPTQVQNETGEVFAKAMTTGYDDLAVSYAPIGRIKALLDLVALAHGLEAVSPEPPLRFWLQEYNIAYSATPTEHPLLKKEATIAGAGYTFEVSGGVTLEVSLSRLNEDGDITVVRDLVLNTRPKGTPLTWTVPLEGWRLPVTPGVDAGVRTSAEPKQYSSRSHKNVGMSLTERIVPGGSFRPTIEPAVPWQTPTRTQWSPHMMWSDRLPSQSYASRVGGVMLQGTATIAGGQEAQVDLSKGHFALIVEGQSTRLDPAVFRKFLTALWAVYYCAQEPGVSIDPIAPGVQKHLVRYIGCHVINSDLGRVMREADYLMKKWAVGTERPNLPGFKDVDDLMAKFGFRYVGASRRFWFVPEAMRFKRCDDLLLFDSGRMTVKTEYVVQNKSVKSEPADEAFARFFTEQYPAIAAKYPVYSELFEYAKLVALAKYLKEQKVPLFWFLMANKDLVLTEDSPGTVDALAKGSKHFDGISIQGGVDLNVQGQYVYDQQAVRAIHEAVAKLPASMSASTSLSAQERVPKPSPAPFAFELEKRRYTVVPQHSLTSGKDRHGTRYQTDLAVWQHGQPGLELVRYYRPGQGEAGEFGHGWHLLVPYRLQPIGAATRQFLNAIIPEQMAVVNLLTGEQEVLTFSTERYTIAGYVPDKLGSSQLIGLFLMSNASYRLADKLGNEFRFDQAGSLTDMLFGTEHHIRYAYLHTVTDAFEQAPYHLEPADTERIPFLNARIPKRMRITDLIYGTSEVLEFSDQGRIAGYTPETAETSRFQLLALLSNAAFRLLDKAGNEIAFAPSGAFTGMIVASERRMLGSMVHGNQRVDFTYTVDASGQVHIASARLAEGKEGSPITVMRYLYDEAGRLMRVQGPVSHVATLSDQSKVK